MKKVIVALLICLGSYDANCMRYSMPRGSTEGSATSVVQRPVENYYNGNPQTRESVLYMYLCRRGGSPMEKNCKCGKCLGDYAGLSLGFICLDGGTNDFMEIGPDTSNILWSMHVIFGSSRSSGCCLYCRAVPGVLKARYCYNESVYSQIEDLYSGRVCENPEFLHDEDGNPCERRNIWGRVSGRPDAELSISYILRTSVFCFKVPCEELVTISNILGVLGQLGEKKQEGEESNRVLGKYNMLGIGGNNCATFCKSALGRCFSIVRWRVNPFVKRSIYPFSTSFISSVLGGVVSSSLSEDTLHSPTEIAAVAGGVVGAVGYYITSTLASSTNVLETSTPEGIIDECLDNFQKLYVNGDESFRNAITECFSVVVHDKSEIRRYLDSGRVRFDPSYKIGLRKISDVIRFGVRIKKTKGKIFFEDDFEEETDGGCLLM